MRSFAMGSFVARPATPRPRIDRRRLAPDRLIHGRYRFAGPAARRLYDAYLPRRADLPRATSRADRAGDLSARRDRSSRRAGMARLRARTDRVQQRGYRGALRAPTST